MSTPHLLRYYADAAPATAHGTSAPPPPAFEDLVDVKLDATSVGQQFKVYGLREEAAGEAELPLAGPYRFLITDSGFNRRGDKVMTKGGDFAAYKKNPVVLWAHESWTIPVGNCALSFEGDKVYAAVTFDIDDPEGARLAGSVRRGFTRACSIGIRLIALAQRLKEGGSHEGWDITEWEMLELSICPVGANSRALKNAYGTPAESLSAVASALGWKADPLAIMSLSPAEIAGIRRDLTPRQLAQELLDRRGPEALSIGFRQLGLAAPWENPEAWCRFSAALGDSADPGTAARCATAAGLNDLAGWLREIPAPAPVVQLAASPAAPAPAPPAPVLDTQTFAAQVVAGIAPVLAQLTTAVQGRIQQANLGAVAATGTPLLAN